MLSEETAGSLAKSLKNRFNIRIDLAQPDVVGLWQRVLFKAGVSDENAAAMMENFSDRWTKSVKPTLQDFAKYAKLHTPRKGVPPRPPGEECALCGSTGWLPICAPAKSLRAALDPGNQRFTPPNPWAETPVYAVGVPCLCTVGQRAEGKEKLKPVWAELRKRFVAWYKQDGHMMNSLNRYLRECAKAWAAKFAARQMEITRQLRETDDAEKRAVLEQQAEDLSKAEFDHMLDTSEDVPEEEIPF